MWVDDIDGDLKAAMLAGDRLKVEVLRGLKSSLKNQAIAESTDIANVDLSTVVIREIKKRQQSIDLYKKAGRHELAEKEEKESDILSSYLPSAPSDKDLDDLVNKTIFDTEAVSMNDMGKVMKALQAKLEGGIDNSKLAEMVKSKLSGS